MTKIEAYRDAVAKAKVVADQFLAEANRMVKSWEPTIQHTKSEVMVRMLDMTMQDLLEETMKTRLSIAERISLGEAAHRKVYDILPCEMVVELVRSPKPIPEIVTDLLKRTEARQRADTIRHDMSNDPRVTPVKVGGDDAYAVDFNTREELIDFMMEKFGLDRAGAEKYAQQ